MSKPSAPDEPGISPPSVTAFCSASVASQDIILSFNAALTSSSDGSAPAAGAASVVAASATASSPSARRRLSARTRAGGAKARVAEIAARKRTALRMASRGRAICCSD